MSSIGEVIKEIAKCQGDISYDWFLAFAFTAADPVHAKQAHSGSYLKKSTARNSQTIVSQGTLVLLVRKPALPSPVQLDVRPFPFIVGSPATSFRLGFSKNETYWSGTPETAGFST